MKPEQTACTSNAAPRVMPIRACTLVAVEGKVSSGVVVATMTRSISSALDAGVAQRRARRRRRDPRSLAFRGDVAAQNAGAVENPRVAGVDHAASSSLLKDSLGQDTPRSPTIGTHVTISAAAGRCRLRGACRAKRCQVCWDCARSMPTAPCRWRLDGAGKAQCVRAAVALHYHAVEPKKHAAIGAARVHLPRAARNAPRGEQCARARRTANAVSALAQKVRDSACAVPSAVFSATLPVKPSVTTTSTEPVPMSSPSTKPQNSIGSLEVAQDVRRAASPARCPSLPLRRYSATHGRPFDAEDGAGESFAHDGEIDQLLGVASALAPTSRTMLCPRMVGQITAMAGRGYPSMSPGQTSTWPSARRCCRPRPRPTLPSAPRHRCVPHAGILAATERLDGLLLHRGRHPARDAFPPAWRGAVRANSAAAPLVAVEQKAHLRDGACAR